MIAPFAYKLQYRVAPPFECQTCQPSLNFEHVVPQKMFRFLELPLEIRMMVYRSLRTNRSLRLNHPNDRKAIGYASYGFRPQILATNHQVSYEAMQVFYGENFWTLYAGEGFDIRSVAFKLPPLSSAMPYIRKVFIRMRMFNWLYIRTLGIGYSLGSPPDFSEIALVLRSAPSLQSVQIAWTETALLSRPWGRGGNDLVWLHKSGQLVDEMSWLIWEFMKALRSLAPGVKITKGQINALWRCKLKCIAMEAAFEQCVETLISHHAAATKTCTTSKTGKDLNVTASPSHKAVQRVQAEHSQRSIFSSFSP